MLCETFFINVEGKVAINHCAPSVSAVMNELVANLVNWRHTGELTEELGEELIKLAEFNGSAKYARDFLLTLTDKSRVHQIINEMPNGQVLNVTRMARYSITNIVHPLDVIKGGK